MHTMVDDWEMIALMRRQKWGQQIIAAIAVTSVFALAINANGQSLRGSGASLDRQNRQALQHDFSYLRDANHVQRFVGSGLLVSVYDSADYWLKEVSFPVARPAVKLFIQRLGSQYRAACGERLVVTSLTRPIASQPGNASRRSVHPTGMALDLRRPYPGRCRTWLEETLLQLEGRGILEATRETSPAHYHIALYSEPYVSHVSRLTGQSAEEIISLMNTEATYTVKLRDTLWHISRRYDTTPEAIQRANGLRTTYIYPGQLLKIPARQR